MIKKNGRVKFFSIIFLFFISFFCDSTAKFFPYNIQFDELQVVSAVPVKKNPDGKWQPACREKSSGVIFNVNLLSIERGQKSSDRDLSIRPGDGIKGSGKNIRFIVTEGKHIGKQSIELSIECLEKYPDPDITKERYCQGFQKPSVTIENFKYQSDIPPNEKGYYPRLTKEKDKFAYALLIDHSGSILGKVYQIYEECIKKYTPEKCKYSKNYPYKETPKDASDEWPGDRDEYSSDPGPARIAAAKDFIYSLNDNDKVIVFAYGEEFGETPYVVCKHPLIPNPTEEQKQKDCFLLRSQINLNPKPGEKRDPITEGFDDIQYTAGGRTPLWSAMDYVYEFMKKQPYEYKHIIVISDGPDTCHYVSEEYILRKEGACSNTSFIDFYNKLQSDITAKKIGKIHIHFVQFQSRGYPNHDPSQQEVACMTDGNYIFVNSLDLSKEEGTPIYNALKENLLKVRYSFAGVWKLFVGLPVLGVDADFPNGVPKGNIYGIGGVLTLKAGNFTKFDQNKPFNIGSNKEGGLGNLDERVSFRKSCDNKDECKNKSPSELCKEDTCLSISLICGRETEDNNTKCDEGKICCLGECIDGDKCEQ